MKSSFPFTLIFSMTLFLLLGVDAHALTPPDCFKVSESGNSITGYVCTDIDVAIPSGINGQKITSIEDHAFYCKDLTSVEIPNSVTKIGSNAFFGNKLTSVDIPNSVLTIEDEAFSSNKLTRIDIPDSVTKIGREAFYYNNLKSVVVPDSVTPSFRKDVA